MPSSKRSTEQLRYDHENEAIAQAERNRLYSKISIEESAEKK